MPFKVPLLTILLLFAGSSFAQQTEADSLESLIQSVPSDTTKVWLLNRLVTTLRDKDNNKALLFAEQAKNLAQLLTDKKGMASALENLSWLLYRKGDFSKSLDLSTQALHISEEINDQGATARSLVNIAAIHYEQKQYDLAIENFRKSYVIARAIGDQHTMARNLNNIAFSFLGLKEIDSAFVNSNRALLLGQASKDNYLIAFARRTIGDIYLTKNKVDDALFNFNICFTLSKKYENTFLKASVLHRLGKVYSIIGQYDKSLDYLAENMKISKQYGFKDELEKTYALCADIYFKKNELANAYQFQSQYIKLHDSLHDQRSSEQIALLQIRFDTEMKQAQIELLTKDTALQKGVIERQNVWIYFYGGCLTLLIFLAFVLYYNNRHNRQAKVALEEKNGEIQTQTHQLRNLNSTKDKLFSIISHDLRSPVASLKALMEIAGSSGLSQKEFVEITRALKRNIDSVYDDLDNLLLWAQTQLRGLQAFPEIIDLRKIVDEKMSLFTDLAGNKKITMINAIPVDSKVFADRNHIGIVFRNLIANAIKFNSPGGLIKVTCLEKSDYYEISVSDSGVGITSEEMSKLFNAETHFTKPGTLKEKGMGIGLLLAKEFLENNQGSIRVTSVPGNGTTFIFTLKASRQEVYA